ncbi:MAG: PIN domain-containing protein [Acidobacteriota bacterium]
MVYIADTHAIVWFLDKAPRLSQVAKNTLSTPGLILVIPTIALAEITHLYSRGRIKVSAAMVKQKILSAANCSTHPLDEDVVAKIPGSLDIHDAIIVATALVYRDIRQQPTTLITKDGKITQSGLIQTLW